MSQNVKKASALKTIVAVAIMSTSLYTPLAANAAVVPSTDLSRPGQYLVKSPLSDWAEQDERLIDWRNPQSTLKFDMPVGDWTDKLSLHLSATPDNVHPGAQLLVSFNGGKAIPIESDGHKFDAEITLSALRIRPVNNKLTISLATPLGADCLNASHGTCSVDLSRSKLHITARPKNRTFPMSEFETRLKNRISAPDSVSIVAMGEHKIALEALAAQGVAMRMDSLPSFKASSRAAELKVYMGTRSELKSRLSDPALIKSQGAGLLITEGRPLGLVITGDTADEVLVAARNFARYYMPNVTRSYVNANELIMQPQFSDEAHAIEKSANLHQLGDTQFAASYRPEAVNLDFHVADTAGVNGQVVLKLAKNDAVADDSRVNVLLNGQALGYTELNKQRKTVAFDLPAGALKASQNKLTIEPEMNNAIQGCPGYNFEPGLGLEIGSKIKLSAPQNRLSLSRFAASGAPFATDFGEKTTVLIGSTQAERLAAQSLLAKAAQSSGTGWSNAEFTSNVIEAKQSGDHVLMLGQMHEELKSFAGAPRALTDAARGLAGTVQNVQFASLSEADTLRQYAELTSQQRQSLTRGGTAALYTSSAIDGNIVGVITANSSAEFASAANLLVKDEHWDQLSGTVTRWDRERVLLAQDNMASLALPQSTTSPASSGNSMIDTLANSTKAFASAAIESGQSLIAKLSRRDIPVQNVATQPPAAVKPEIKAAPTNKIAAPAIAPVIAPKAIIATPPLTAQTPSLRGPATVQYAALPPQGTETVLSKFGSSIKSALDMDDFDMDYFIANSKAKITALRNRTAHKTQITPQARDLSRGEEMIMGNSKILLMLMIGVFAMLMMGFAAPASSNKNY